MAKNFSPRDKSALFSLQIKSKPLGRILKNQKVDRLISFGTEIARELQISKAKNSEEVKEVKNEQANGFLYGGYIGIRCVHPRLWTKP